MKKRKKQRIHQTSIIIYSHTTHTLSHLACVLYDGSRFMFIYILSIQIHWQHDSFATDNFITEEAKSNWSTKTKGPPKKENTQQQQQQQTRNMIKAYKRFTFLLLCTVCRDVRHIGAQFACTHIYVIIDFILYFILGHAGTRLCAPYMTYTWSTTFVRMVFVCFDERLNAYVCVENNKNKKTKTKKV